MRRTRADIEQALNVVCNKTGLDLRFDWTANRPRIVLQSPEGGLRDIGPRLTTTQMYHWIEALDAGVDLGLLNLEMGG